MAERDSRHPGSIVVLLIVILLLAAVAGFVLFVPRVRCPNCDVPTFLLPEKCYRCSDRRQITLYDRWRHGNSRETDWEGKVASTLRVEGFVKTSGTGAAKLTGLREGLPMTRPKVEDAIKALLETKNYQDVDVIVSTDPRSPDMVIVTIRVVEQ